MSTETETDARPLAPAAALRAAADRLTDAGEATPLGVALAAWLRYCADTHVMHRYSRAIYGCDWCGYTARVDGRPCPELVHALAVADTIGAGT